MSKSFGKRLLAIVLSVLMVMTLMPTGMFAADSVEVTADNYQELLNVPLSVNSYMQDHVGWNWNGCGWNSTTLGGTVSVDEDWFGDTYDSILTSDNTSEWTVNPSFCLSITDGGYLTESDKEVGYTGEEHTYNFTYSDIVIAATGYNDVTISGATVETVFQFVQYSGYTGGTSYDIDLLTPIMEQTGLTLQQVAEEYIPAIYNVKFSATLNSFDGVSYSDIQAYLDGSGSGETGDTGEYDLSGYTLSYSEDINLAASNYSWYTFSDTAIVDAMATEGSKFVVTRSTSVTEANYDKFGLVDAWFSMDWLNLGTAISKAADETGTATVIDCEFDNGVTVVYDGTTIYNALVAAGFYSGAAAQFISNTSTETYTITNVSVYVPTTTSTSTTLPWELTSTDYVSNWDPVTFYQVAIDGLEINGWTNIIQVNSSESWYEDNLDLWSGFVKAMLAENARLEITSTASDLSIYLQSGGNFGYQSVSIDADSCIDNGDGTYTSCFDCAAAISDFGGIIFEGYEDSPSVPTSSSDWGDLFGLVVATGGSATLSSIKIVDSTASSGDSGDSGITPDTGDYDFSGYTVAGTASFTDFTSGSWESNDSFDMAIIEALNTEGSLLVITRSEYDANAAYDKFLLVDTWWSMTGSDGNSTWLALGTSISKATDSEGPADVDCIFDNGTTVVYDGATVYAALMELGLNTSSGADMSLISNSGSVSYNITSVTAYVPTTASVLSWVDEAVAENNLTISGPTWWYGIIYCTEAYEGEVGEYADGVSADLDGFLAAIACDDAVIEITSTGSGIDQIFIQKGDYSGTDSLNMTVTDNGDGTYTSTLSGAELSAYADAVVEAGDSIWKIMINKTTDCDTVITSISVYVPGSTSLPWVDEPLAENNPTLSGQVWWTQLIICTEAASEEDYDSYVSTDMEGFLAAIAENDAVLEITSTGSGVDQIFFQYKISDEVYDATDAISMNITDNGDGTYTSAVSGADLNALVTAFEAEGCSAWKLWINKTTDCDTVITSMQVVEGTIVEPEDTEFDLSSYTLWYSEEVNIASSDWGTYEFTDTSWVDALTADGAILVISRDTDTVTFSGSDVWDKFFIFDSSWANQISLGTKTSTDCMVNKSFDNGSMIVYSGASVYNALTSAGVDPAILVNNSTADTYNITSVSVYIPTATILAANQEMIDNLTALLLSYDDVVYINQSDAEDFNGYFSAGWSEICASSWDWDEIASIWTTSLGEEATVMIDYSDYVAPVAGTTDDLDGTDGSITLTYYAYVGDSEAGTYVTSQTYTVTIVIKATQLYHIEIPTDPDGRFTVTPSTEYATEGERVTVTIETAEGYKVSEVRAWYQDENGNTNSIGLGYYEDTGVWFMYMPAYDIWMDVTVGTLDVNYVYDSDAVLHVSGVAAANEGEEVTFYVYVNRGYELDGEITAVDENGNTVTLTEVDAGLLIMDYKPSTSYAYSFTMPDSSVTITATSFKAIDGFIDGAFYITDYGYISCIDQVDFTDSDTYLVISYDLMFESDENVDNYGDWSPGAIYAVNDNGEWIQLCEIPSYYSSNGTFAISLTDIAALASDAGCNIDTYGVIINWWVNDDEYASNETFMLSNDYHEIVLMDSDGQVNISSRSYKQGDTATFTLDSLVDAPVISVTAVDSNGNSVEVTATDASNLEYTLTMPDSTVWITVTFADSYTSIVFQYGQCWDLSEGLFNSAFVDLDDENLYLRVEYVMTGDTDSYGEIQYSTDFENTVHLTEVPVNENGITFISLKALSEAASELGYDGYFLFGVDLGSFDVDQSLVSIVTIGEYTTEESKVGEVITIGNQDYEVAWDTTEVNPGGVAYGYHNLLGWSEYGMHSNWWSTFEGFKSSLLNHLDDGSLIAVEGNEQTGKWLVLYDSSIYYAWEVPAGNTYSSDGTAVYISIDEIVEKAEENGWEVTQEYVSAISHDAQENTLITAVRILTPLTYEVDSTAWSVDMTSATVKLVAGNHVVYVDATDVISEVTEATCTTAGQVVYTATAAYNGQVFEVSTTATIPATGHTEAEAVVENRVEATCTEDGSYDSVVYCSVCGEELSRETVTIPATGHTEGEAVEENRVEATCTEDGSYDSVVYCSVCGEELSRETITIPATGHEYVAVVTDPTCTESGYTTYTCSICGDSYTADETEATGHDYGEPEWTWSGYTSATATFTCGNDSTHVEVVTAEITSVTTNPTCEEDGETVYTATVTFNGETYTTTTTEVLSATGHDWTVSYEWSEDGKTCTATRSCANDSTHDVSETVTTVGAVTVQPTCTEKGTTTYTATFTSDWAETKTMDVVDVDALGHTEGEAVEENRVEATCESDGSYDTVIYCSVCGAELSRETTTIPATGHTEAEAVEENRVEATCTEDGSYDTVIYCSVCGEELSRETTTIPAIGHNYGEPVWTWSGYTSATATFTCGNDSTHVEVVTAEITSATTAATCEDDGETVYTATVTFNGETYTTTATEVLSATGHDWTVSYEWSEDGKTCTATRSCANDSTHNVSETVTTVGAVTVQPTCTEKGTTTYTATFTSDWAETKTMDVVDVDALGHDWSVEYTWSEDGKSCTATHVCGRDSTHNESETVTTSGTETVAPTCTEKGTTTYTATFTSDWAETKTMDVVDIDALGHTYGEPEFTWDESTCTATATFTCTVCQHTMTLETDRSVETTNATCTEDGKIVYTAAVTYNNVEYTDTYEVAIPATGHSTEIQGAKDATCTEDGYTGDEVCTICGETVAYGETIPAAHAFGDDGVCTVCGAKKDNSTETTEPTVSVESGDVIFAEVLPSGLVTEVEIKLSVDSGTVVVSTVTEDDSNPHLVEHISDTLGFELFNEAQGDDLVKDTDSFTITDGNSTTPKKATILFYGDIDYDGNSASVTMTFAATTALSKSDIYVLHYTGVGTTWEIVSSTSNASGKTLTVDFDATSFSPYVVVSVANVSSTSGGTTVLDILLKVSADYSAVNDAIAKAAALDPADYVDFTAVTEAINAVNWNLTAINQQAVTAYADAINAAIDALVEVTSITEEDVNIDEPIEDSTTETEDEEVTTPIATPVDSEESNPTTGLALSLLPMAMAALAAVSSKRR